MNLKYSLNPSGSFYNLILEDFNGGRCLVVMTFSDRKLADCALENADSFLDHFYYLARLFDRCKTAESACEHLNFCFGYLSALHNYLTFTCSEKSFVEECFVKIYNRRIGEIKNETCE